LGNIIGAYVTGIFLFEMIGTKGALIVTLLVLYLSVVFLTSFNRQYGNSRWRAPIMGALAVFFLFVAVPQNYYMSFGLGRYQPIDVIEGKTGVLSVVPSDESYYRLDMFRTESAAVLARYSERGLSEWNMSELFVLDPSFRPKKLLIIGMGHGYLARAMMDYPFIESITLVELSQEVVDAVKKYSAPEMMEIFTSPKVNLVVADGRRFVQQSLDRGETYDLIQININNPWRTGASSLYTEEFIAKLKSSLAPDGYLATRAMIGYVVQGLYSFKQAFWPGRTHVYFRDSTDRFTGPLEVRSEIAEFYLPPDFASNSSTSTTANDVSDVLEIAYFDQSFLNGFQRNVDDHPTFEYRYLEDRLNRYRNPKVFMVTMDLAEFVSPVEVKVTEFD
jgi:spermidine synthase